MIEFWTAGEQNVWEFDVFIPIIFNGLDFGFDSLLSCNQKVLGDCIRVATKPFPRANWLRCVKSWLGVKCRLAKNAFCSPPWVRFFARAGSSIRLAS